MSTLQRVRSQTTLTDQVFASLRSAITSGAMPVGEKHSVGSVALQLGVSRTPVREAVLQLANLGLVEILKNQGFVVTERDRRDVEQVFQLRIWLEVPAAGIAATQADDKARARIQSMYDRMLRAAEEGDVADIEKWDAGFHAAILDVADNPRLSLFVGELRDLLITRRHTTTDRANRLTDVAHDHDGILEAILAGDAPRAEKEMREHLDIWRDGVIEQLS